MPDENSLAFILQKFNRKEEYWILREIFAADKLPDAEKCFLKKFRENFTPDENNQLERPGQVWWSINYKFNWIFGAIRVYAYIHGGGKDIKKFDTNFCASDTGEKYQLTERSPEDIDLILAFDETIILIEVKGVGDFDQDQVTRKVKRFIILRRFAQECKPDIKIKMFFMSPQTAKHEDFIRQLFDGKVKDKGEDNNICDIGKNLGVDIGRIRSDIKCIKLQKLESNGVKNFYLPERRPKSKNAKSWKIIEPK